MVLSCMRCSISEFCSSCKVVTSLFGDLLPFDSSDGVVEDVELAVGVAEGDG